MDCLRSLDVAAATDSEAPPLTEESAYSSGLQGAGQRKKRGFAAEKRGRGHGGEFPVAPLSPFVAVVPRSHRPTSSDAIRGEHIESLTEWNFPCDAMAENDRRGMRRRTTTVLLPTEEEKQDGSRLGKQSDPLCKGVCHTNLPAPKRQLPHFLHMEETRVGLRKGGKLDYSSI